MLIKLVSPSSLTRLSGRNESYRGVPALGLAEGRAADEDEGRARHGRLKACSLRRLADLYRDQGYLDKAVEYYEECIEAFQADVDEPIARARALSFCGRTQAERKQWEAARDRLSRALELFAERPLGRDDPEAKVVDAWLQRLNND